MSHMVYRDLFLFHLNICYIFLTCRKVLYTEQAIIPTCFRRCQDIVVQFKVFILVFSSIEIRLKYGTACQDRQEEESVAKRLFRRQNRMERVGFESKSQSGRS